MVTYSASVHFRYLLLLNALIALAPALLVKGRENDPLLHAAWWSHAQHSAVLVVSAAAILGTVISYLLIWRNLRRWWIFLLSGAFTGISPGLFYLVVAPLTDEGMVTVVAMLIVGAVWGAPVGLVIYAVVGKPVRRPEPNNGWRGP
jgi:hypothetical protein